MYLPVVCCRYYCYCCCCCCWVGGLSLEHIKQIARVLGFASMLQRRTHAETERATLDLWVAEWGRCSTSKDRKQAHHEPEPWPLKSGRAAVSVCLSIHVCLFFSNSVCMCVWCCIRTSCCPESIHVSRHCPEKCAYASTRSNFYITGYTGLYTIRLRSFSSSSVICPSLHSCFHLHRPSSHSLTAQRWKMMFFQVSHNADAVTAWMEIAFIPSPVSAIPTFSHHLWFAFDTWGMCSGRHTTGVEKGEGMFLTSVLIRPVWRMEAGGWDVDSVGPLSPTKYTS